jgi:hypothetical protein
LKGKVHFDKLEEYSAMRDSIPLADRLTIVSNIGSRSTGHARPIKLWEGKSALLI